MKLIENVYMPVMKIPQNQNKIVKDRHLQSTLPNIHLTKSPSIHHPAVVTRE